MVRQNLDGCWMLFHRRRGYPRPRLADADGVGGSEASQLLEAGSWGRAGWLIRIKDGTGGWCAVLYTRTIPRIHSVPLVGILPYICSDLV